MIRSKGVKVNKGSLRELILYVIKLHMKYASRGLGRTKLMKILFLIDYYALNGDLGRKITGLKWFRWYYGPFNNEVFPTLNELVKENKVKLDIHVYDDFRIEYMYYATNPSIKDIELPEEIKNIVNKIVKKYAKKTLNEVLNDVYEKMGNKGLGEEIL